MKTLVTDQVVHQKIFIIRGQKIMFSHDLAVLYGVTTFNLNKAVQRNLHRFPPDFMFQLTREEGDSLKFQIGISKKKGRGGRRRDTPYAFTEQGVAMLSSVLRSRKALKVNIEIMRAFVRIREVLSVHKDLAHKLEALERKFNSHDVQFKVVFDAIKKLMEEPDKPRKRIGFI